MTRVCRFLQRFLFRIRNTIISAPFNFKNLPFGQAVHIPILLNKAKVSGNGKYYIESKKIRFGMVQLGFWGVGIYPDNGIVIQNNGVIVFKGRAAISNDSYLSVGNDGVLVCGDDFEMNASKIACHNKIELGDFCSIGFGSILVDSDFHRLSCVQPDGKKTLCGSGYGEIHLKRGCWCGMNCLLLKNTYVPDYCVIGARSLLNKKYDVPQYSLLAGCPAVLKKTGVFRDREAGNDRVKYGEE